MRLTRQLPRLIADTSADVLRRWPALLAADLLAKVLGLALISPMLTGAWRFYLYWTGQPVLTDGQIATFFAHPLGWLALVLIGGATAAAVALGCGAMVWIAAGRASPGIAGGIGALAVTIKRWLILLKLSSVVIGGFLVAATPFLLAIWLIYRGLLTEFDINYYLAVRPPAFWSAVVLTVVVLSGLGVVWLGLAMRWVMTLPLVILDDASVGAALRGSGQLARGNGRLLLRVALLWLASWWVFALIVSTAVWWVARLLISQAGEALWGIALLAGGALVVWSLGQLLIAVAASTSLGVVVVRLYARLGGAGVQTSDHDAESLADEAIGWKPRWIVLGVGGIAVVSAWVGVAAIQAVPIQDQVTITAHRGASVAAPENTMAAFELAIQHRADFIELDVQETRDGRVAVVHDQDLLRLGGRADKVWDRTLAELQTTLLRGPGDDQYPDETVPELGDVLEMARGRIDVNIELKFYGHDDQLEHRVVELVEQYDMQNNIVVMSLHATSVQKIREMRPDWTVGLLAAKTLGDLGRADVDFFAVHHALSTPAFIRSAHDRGQQVHAWTVNDPVLMSSLISRGVDVLITDDPALARRVLDERAELTLAERVLLDLTVRLGLND